MNDSSHIEVSSMSLIGADAFSHLRHDSSSLIIKAELSKKLPVKTPNATEIIDHKRYLEVREELKKAATFAGFANEVSSLDTIVSQWYELQQRYAKQVVKEVNEEIKEQKGLLDAANEELAAGQVFINEFHDLSKKPIGQLGINGIKKYTELETKVRGLETTRETRDLLHRTVTSIGRIEESLTQLRGLGKEAVHYEILSSKEALEKLGEEKYDGPKFDPLLLTNKTDIVDKFNRDVSTTAVRAGRTAQKLETKIDVGLEDLPPVLSELVRLQRYISEQAPETRILAADLVKTLELKELGSKGIGSYLEDNEVTFGVKTNKGPTGARSFTRTKAATPDAKGLVTYMTANNLKNLQGPDTKQVNEFYFGKAIDLLRELPEAYEGFTKEEFQGLAARNNLPVTPIYMARSLSSGKYDTDIKCIDPSLEKYKLKEVKPTETQLRYILEVVREEGENQFEPRRIAEVVTRRHKDYRMIELVAVKALEQNHTNWGYRQSSSNPIAYQKLPNSKKVGVEAPKTFM